MSEIEWVPEERMLRTNGAFRCMECGAPATWFRYEYDDPEDYNSFDCRWYCDECRRAMMNPEAMQ